MDLPTPNAPDLKDEPSPAETLRFVRILFRMSPERRQLAYQMLERLADNERMDLMQ